ncbi:MAG TPA: nucleotidyltransferase domain-containing protein [Gemmatimonadota bacterium]|nr:nucleotidyltransferase domain-containing protein [Gemmatimonadota bacterium]
MGNRERWKRMPELPPDIERSIDRLHPLFEERNVLLAYLFGSLSRDEDRAPQDLDLAILRRDDAVYRLRAEIADRVGSQRLDLVDLATASPVLRFEIVRTGRLVYEADSLVTERFELETIRLYRDTAHLRRSQLKHLSEKLTG